MCGIFGQFSRRASVDPVETLCELTNRMTHRGPDFGAYWADQSFFLGHRRLSIIDLAGGNQPMSTQDGSLVVTFNGEIYNYIELKRELQGKGYSFATQSDTEVLLHGYREWGKRLPEKLIGMFAFAIADRMNQTLFLARDRFGEKPLFYRESSSAVYFSSELAPLAAIPTLQNEIHRDVLSAYFSLNYLPGTETLIHGIRRVPPGSWRFYTREKTEEQIYYPLHITDRPALDPRGGFRGAANFLQEKIDASVRLALRSDVPVAVFLSGGIDSSIVAESACRQGAIARAFCLDIQESNYSEWENARYVADRLALPLERVVLQPGIMGEFLQIARHLDDPLADSSALAVWALSREVSKNYKVTLSGDGGDEAFGGYLTHRATLYYQSLHRLLPGKLRQAMAGLADAIPVSESKVSMSYKLRRFFRAARFSPGCAHFSWNGAFVPEDARRFLDVHDGSYDPLYQLARTHGLQKRLGLADLQLADLREYLPNDILVKMDRMTMAFGLESRAPLLHPEVAEYGLSLPQSYKLIPGVRSKRILREIADRHFGRRISAAKKQGFSIPIHTWLRESARDLVESVLSESQLKKIPVLKANEVLAVKRRHMVERQPLGHELWGLMVFVNWYNQVFNQPKVGLEPKPKPLHRLEAMRCG